jgi:hypothetical protein
MDTSENVLVEFKLPQDYLDDYNKLTKFEIQILKNSVLELIDPTKWPVDHVNQFVKESVMTFIDKKREYKFSITGIDLYNEFMGIENAEKYPYHNGNL